MHKVFSELFHGSARVIIRSLEGGLARDVEIGQASEVLCVNSSRSEGLHIK